MSQNWDLFDVFAHDETGVMGFGEEDDKNKMYFYHIGQPLICLSSPLFFLRMSYKWSNIVYSLCRLASFS